MCQCAVPAAARNARAEGKLANNPTIEERAQTLSQGAPLAGKLHEQVAVALGTEIASGQLPEGSYLPTEMEGVARFCVSRATYREAIRSLASKGLITSRAKTGTRVNPRHQWAMLDPQVIAWIFSSKPTMSAVRALFELRQIIEPAAAALAAERRNAKQLHEIGRAFDDMARHGYRSAEGQAADGRFHQLILNASGNDFLVSLNESIATAIRWTTILKAAASTKPRDPIPLHLELYHAIVDADPVRSREAALNLLAVAREDTECVLE